MCAIRGFVVPGAVWGMDRASLKVPTWEPWLMGAIYGYLGNGMACVSKGHDTKVESATWVAKH